MHPTWSIPPAGTRRRPSPAGGCSVGSGEVQFRRDLGGSQGAPHSSFPPSCCGNRSSSLCRAVHSNQRWSFQLCCTIAAVLVPVQPGDRGGLGDGRLCSKQDRKGSRAAFNVSVWKARGVEAQPALMEFFWLPEQRSPGSETTSPRAASPEPAPLPRRQSRAGNSPRASRASRG